MFIDTARLTVAAGNGGNGAIAFHREKYVANGGPDGGDGGNGGSVIFRVDDHMSTLMDYQYRKKFSAENGGDGAGKKCSGKAGSDLYIKVPRGAVILDSESRAVIHDMSDGKDFTVCKGGSGGWGNQRFATPTRQAPRFAKSGLKGEVREIILELKLLADVGLVGFPNVGKSTLLSIISAARPKIANYHFTTLQPNLGVVRVEDGDSFVVADIPGIIEGAHEGAGLGHDFLRHIDRCRLLIHVVDVSGSEGRDPIEDFETITNELKNYSEGLSGRPQIVAANKCDITEERLDSLREHLNAKGISLMPISAAANRGIRELVYKVSSELKKLPPIEYYEAEYVEKAEVEQTAADVKITADGDLYILEGEWLEKIMTDVNFDDYESRIYFERQLKRSGIFERLERLGIKEGDTVSMYGLEFDYVK
ncbi:MAG: GTPase ObgE [Oscillospiraceae bacterium]|jgi:GTP-binding protein|nr:GTPase ObgE [Oscillospiraceae bacterium]